MNSAITKLLYSNAFNNIESARNCQIIISKKEMEIQMININIKYPVYDDLYINNLKKHTLGMEIKNLVNTRNNYINNAISDALSLAENEMFENNEYSVVAILIGSIVSFITSVENTFSASFPNRSNISRLSTRFKLFDFKNVQLKNSINDLKTVCKVY